MITIERINAGKLNYKIRHILIELGIPLSFYGCRSPKETKQKLERAKIALKQIIENRLDEVKAIRGIGNKAIKVFAEWCGAKLPDEKKPVSLKAQIAELKNALEQIATLGNGDRYGKSISNMIAISALIANDGVKRMHNKTKEECKETKKENK